MFLAKDIFMQHYPDVETQMECLSTPTIISLITWKICWEIMNSMPKILCTVKSWDKEDSRRIMRSSTTVLSAVEVKLALITILHPCWNKSELLNSDNKNRVLINYWFFSLLILLEGKGIAVNQLNLSVGWHGYHWENCKNGAQKENIIAE